MGQSERSDRYSLVATLIADLARALPAALVAGVLPGYFWACFLRRTDGLAERLTYSTAMSLATVPALAIVLARILGTGISLGVAIATVLLVAGSGALACKIWGTAAARGPAQPPVLPRLGAIRDGRALALIAVAIGLALASALGLPTSGWLLLLILAALVVAGLLAQGRAPAPEQQAEETGPAFLAAPTDAETTSTATTSADTTSAETTSSTATSSLDTNATATSVALAPSAADATAARPRSLLNPGLRAPALLAILALTLVRGYAGVIVHDWPYVRGEDQFSHAVMTEQMMAHGQYSSYLIYPPGWSSLSAVICRFCDLPPLSVFPVITPALLVLTTLAAYALATRLWGWEFGLAAAALSGLVLVGPYVSFAGGLYPDLTAAFFLLVMVIGALVSLYQSPTLRSGLLLAAVGAAVVLFHSVGAEYLAVTLAGVCVVCLPYLVVWGGRDGRRIARALVLSLGGLGVLSLAYAWHIYHLGNVLSKHASTRSTVALDVGSQSVLRASDLLSWVGSPIIWLGVLGFAALAAATVRFLRQPAQVAAALTLLAWCAVMYAGSRTALDGFPQRYERDVGAPLTILGALALVLIVQSMVQLQWRPSRRLLQVLAATATVVVVVIAIVQAGSNMVSDSGPSREVLPRPVALAGTWLREHNNGGSIISTPDMNRGITNRAILAMGYYTGLQSYPWARLLHPRSLPTAGIRPLWDSHYVLRDPQSCKVGNILAREDVRYIILYRLGDEADFNGFRTDHTRYQMVYENPAVVIYAPRTPTTCRAGVTVRAVG
jgi:hypothetical protein